MTQERLIVMGCLSTIPHIPVRIVRDGNSAIFDTACTFDSVWNCKRDLSYQEIPCKIRLCVRPRFCE